MFRSDEMVQFQLPVLDADDLKELFSMLQSENPVSSNSGSEASNRTGSSIDDERKRKRKISNRESARRSRWRKKQHLVELTEQLNRFSTQNRELKNQLCLVMNQCNVVKRENDRLTSECTALLSRLSDLCQVLCAMQQLQQP